MIISMVHKGDFEQAEGHGNDRDGGRRAQQQDFFLSPFLPRSWMINRKPLVWSQGR